MTRVAISDVVDAFGVSAGELADVFRREAARLLRKSASDLDVGNDSSIDEHVLRVQRWLSLADACEFEWEVRNPDEPSNEAASGGTEATPSHLNAALVAEQQDTRSAR